MSKPSESLIHKLRRHEVKDIEAYHSLLQEEPQNWDIHWHLGLTYLLDGQEAVAQSIWLEAMTMISEEEENLTLRNFLQILEEEAERQTNQKNLDISIKIRTYIYDIAPNNLKNILCLILDTLRSQTFSLEVLYELNFFEALESIQAKHEPICWDILFLLLHYPSQATLDYTNFCIQHLTQPELQIRRLCSEINAIALTSENVPFAISVLEIAKHYFPENLLILKNLTLLLTDVGQYAKAQQYADHYIAVSQDSKPNYIGQFLKIRSILSSGVWDSIFDETQKQIANLQLLFRQTPQALSFDESLTLIASTLFLPYVYDDPKGNRQLHNNAAQLFQDNIACFCPPYKHARLIQPNPPKLKIGYIAHTLKNHSVGWLSRWLIQHHDQNQFEIHLFLINQRDSHSFTQEWFIQKANYTYFLNSNCQQIAQTIYEQNIDILVDLDSLTLDITCAVLAFKPAPVQVSWLGWDASGLSTVDYFIADPYVLPEDAQEYYREKIWRLPQCYLAVDGFEADVPHLSRTDLGLTSEDIVFMSIQSGVKRHPENLKLQLKIIQNVPNSYLLIKGWSDELRVQRDLLHHAQDMGILSERLRFLSYDANEFIHRAHLELADVILDTYPYNGATTTLETLWMGVPLVTRVGEQFAARNSYTFMHNAGLQEGIAWSDDEYVDWGIKLGTDSQLRQKIAWQLKKGRHVAPLWDTPTFTRQIETAFIEMWSIYVDNRSVSQA